MTEKPGISNDGVAPPINIFSGETGLGAALTNPTELARSKGGIARALRVTYAGRVYADAENAYQQNKTGTTKGNDTMMAEVICAKFRQHPELAAQVRERGGAAWLARCTHYTQARSAAAQSWEGTGLGSRFIRNLVEGWNRFEQGDNAERGQSSLF